ncbi:MAG: choice-of-anchor J domain-containing protein [Bacteroidales bacterium]|jgi:hypothetical protein
MKKLFTLMFLMVFAMATSFSQVLISESFESTTFPPAGWSIKDPTSIASFSWYRSGSGSTLGGGAHTGSGVAYANSGDYSSWGHYVSLVTPSFDLTGLNNVKVTFWMYRNNRYVGYVDYIDVYVNTSPTGMGATLLGTIHRHPTLAPAVGSTSGWYECTFYIPSSFNGSTNYVIFDAVSDWGDDMNIDDVVIEVSNPPLPVIAVNPTNGATGVPVNTQLQWDINPAGGSPTLYKVYVGTDNPPTNIANGVNTTNRWYNLNNLNTGTQYFWQIVPSNASGTAVGNPIWSFTTATYGSLAGTVYDVDGVTPVAGATVYFTPAVAGVLPQTTGADGTFSFGTNTMPTGMYTVGAEAAGYSITTVPNVIVTQNTVTDIDIVMQQPNMAITPNPYNQVLNPNEVFAGTLNIDNSGTGQLDWTATIGGWSSANHDWLNVPVLNGTVASGNNRDIVVNFNATGFEAGQTESAVITFTSVNQTIDVPVSMIVMGTALTPVEWVTAAITNQLNGNTVVSWSHRPEPGSGFQFYSISRNGTQVHVAQSGNVWNGDVLPDYGIYEYCVSAVYADGATAPACATVEWSSPELVYAPTTLKDTLFAGENRPIGPVRLTLGNTGLGTLAYNISYGAAAGIPASSYCAARGGCDEYISRVQFAGIDNSSACTQYGDYSHLVAQVQKGQTYALTVHNGNAWGSDRIDVHFDWNRNGTFETSEGQTITGNDPGTANITIPTTIDDGYVLMRIRLRYGGSINPCGTTSYGEVEDYTLLVGDLSFITDVQPKQGTVPANGNKTIDVWFGATGGYATPGVYNDAITLVTNDVNNPSVEIPAIMTVITPGTLEGTVTEFGTNQPLQNVEVTVGSNTTYTDENGNYSMLLAAGFDQIATYQLIGYEPEEAIFDIFENVTTTVDITLRELANAPNCASAEVNPEDTEVLVEWCVPHGPYQLAYDDGTAENFTAWAEAGNTNAVKFTPKGYPATVIGGRFYVGDGSFPTNGNIIGQPFDVIVYAADGGNGMPGTVLDTITATADNFGWVTVDGLEAVITEGDFYLAMRQMTPAPNCVPLGIDESLPKAFKSYSINQTAGGSWGLSPYQDFMIQAIVHGPLTRTAGDMLSNDIVYPQKFDGQISLYPARATSGVQNVPATVKPAHDFNLSDAVSSYNLQRLSVADPTVAWQGTAIPSGAEITGIVGTTYTDGGSTWAALPAGWYAYCIKAAYPSGDLSECTYTNVVPHKLFADITFNVQLICGFVPAEGAVITLEGREYPYMSATQTVPTGGSVVFNNLIKGIYDVTVTYTGYYTYTSSIDVDGNATHTIILEDIRWAPKNLFVDELTLHATWEESKAALVDEDFEGPIFPPAGWTEHTLNATCGWYATDDGSSDYFDVPPHTTYAISNDDLNNGDSSEDYLDTPVIDLTSGPSYVLTFEHFFTGAYSASGTVKMSTDGGANFTAIYSATPVSAWTKVELDLSAFSGATGYDNVMIRFHFDDGGQWSSGWAIDDVLVESGGVENQGYQFFLDNTIEGPQLPNDQLEYDIPPAHVVYGQTYVAGVAGVYCSGYSEQATYTFTSRFLEPPINLTAEDYSNEILLSAKLMWEAPGGSGPTPGNAFTENFDGTTIPSNWTVVDEDGDGNKWINSNETTQPMDTHNGSPGCAASASFENGVGSYNAKNWLITPAIRVSATSELKFWHDAQDPSWPDNFSVRVSTTTNDIASFTDVIWSGTAAANWSQLTLSLAPYANKNIYIAFYHVDSDKFWLKIDDVEVTNVLGKSATPAPVANATPVAKEGYSFKTAGMTQAQIEEFANRAITMSEVDTNPSYVATAPSVSDEMWDILLNVPLHYTGGEYAVASDGNNIYGACWNGNDFFKYDMDGNYLETFQISGAGSIRDLAYNPTDKVFYGSPNSASIYVMDFTNQTLVSTITTSGSVRHIAYSKDLDGGNGGFYVGGWNDMKSIKMDGSTIATATSPINSVSGSAYDYRKKVLYVIDNGGVQGGPFTMKQMDPDMNYTGVDHDMSDLNYGSWVGGGLAYTKYKNKWALIGCFQNNYMFVYELEGGGPDPINVGGLVGYRLYRDGVAVTPDVSSPDSLYRFDNSMEPGYHCWDITALYDLTDFGFPGEIGESMFALETKPCLDMETGYRLPFHDDFATGLFETKNWVADSNWFIDGNSGNPEPSARFSWTPEHPEYALSLTSPNLNSKTTSLTPHNIKLDFDVKFEDRNQTTAEKLNVEVYNGSSWISVAEFTSNGSFDWVTETVDITPHAKKRVFKIRFNANGALSSDIVYWAVDNVKVYYEWILNAPENLTANREGDSDIFVKWDGIHLDGPAPIQTEWLHYDDGINANGIGISQAGDLAAAIKYDGSDLTNYDGWNIVKVKFFPREAACEYYILVYSGTQLVTNQPVPAPMIDNWNEITLDAPVYIDATKSYTIGYRANTQTGWPLGCDGGPTARAGYSDLISMDGGATFDPLSTVAPNLPYNWNIAVMVQTGGGKGEVVALAPISSNGTQGTLTAVPGEGVATSYEIEVADNTDDVAGYNLYRRAYVNDPQGPNTGNTGDWELLVTKNSPSDTTHLDANVDFLTNNCYEYYVTAVYDEGESEPSNIDYACSYINVDLNANEINIYPNPVTTLLTVQLTLDVEEIVIYNVLGAKIVEKSVRGMNEFTVNTSRFAPGAYSIKFIAKDGNTFTRKFVVTK